MAKTCNVALIGQGFMGRTHSNAYLKVAKFFTDLPVQPGDAHRLRHGGGEPAGLRRALGLEELSRPTGRASSTTRRSTSSIS